jgi:hypothetical protein
MKKNNISEAIGIFVSLSGALVMAGWFFGVGALKSILPVWGSMKFSAALSFAMWGITLYFIARFQKKDREVALIVIPVTSMIVVLLMATMLTSTVIGTNVGIEEMFVKDSAGPAGGATPGRPSVATMLNFILLAAAGFLTTMDIKRLNRAPAIFGTIVAAIGLLAVFGYLTGHPSLYFTFSGSSSPMAIHTAILFVLCGTGTILTERNR